MVRRWSYLNNINDIFFNQYNKLTFTHYQQNFKNTTVFRKEISQLSSLSRKSWARRKHLTNWIIYQNVLTDWSNEYLFFKQYNRSTLSFQLFSNSFLTQNQLLIKKLTASTSLGTEKVILGTITSKITQYTLKSNSFVSHFLRNYKNINWMYVTYPRNAFMSPDLLALFQPIFYISQSTFYQSNNVAPYTTYLQTIFNLLFQIIVLKIVELYKVVVLCNILRLT